MKRYGSEICVALLLAVVISCFGGVIVYASSAENQITDQMELTDLQSMVDEMLGEKTFSVTEAFHRLLSGEEVLSEETFSPIISEEQRSSHAETYLI
jgi:stage III sporulation protein AE